MTDRNKKRMINALTNAAEMIRGHSEVGLSPEDVGEENEAGLLEYVKACEKVSNMINNLTKKYK